MSSKGAHTSSQDNPPRTAPHQKKGVPFNNFRAGNPLFLICFYCPQSRPSWRPAISRKKEVFIHCIIYINVITINLAVNSALIDGKRRFQTRWILIKPHIVAAHINTSIDVGHLFDYKCSSRQPRLHNLISNMID